MSEVLMLDRNAVSALVKGRAPELAARLVRRPFCLSVVTEAELRYGLARRPANTDLCALVTADGAFARVPGLPLEAPD